MAEELLNGGRVQISKAFVVVSVAWLCAACGASTPVTPSDTYTGSIVVENYSATLALGSTRFYSFTAPRDGPVSLTLIELLENGVASVAAVTVGLGRPSGTGCASSSFSTVAAGPTPQISGSVAAGVYCASVSDAGNLLAPARFSLNITRPQ